MEPGVSRERIGWIVAAGDAADLSRAVGAVRQQVSRAGIELRRPDCWTCTIRASSSAPPTEVRSPTP
jgi:hypothetical protein